jgi:CRISPR/Cas system CSM-associated protein Csm3 (group 7 of RAMP superfamily)
MNFAPRWKISGILTLQTPLHIGDGKTRKREQEPEVEIARVVKDCHGKPYLPASAVKGVVSGWLRARLPDRKKLIDQVFGCSVEAAGTEHEGGKAEFVDARIAEPLAAPAHPPPHWNADSHTGVVVGVTLDRDSRTARDQRLFHWEAVPPDTRFELTVIGSGLSGEEITLLLAGLEGFNHGFATLGSETAQGQGRLAWELKSIERLQAEQVKAWLDQGAPGMWWDALQPLPADEQQALVGQAGQLVTSAAGKASLTLDIGLFFDSPFLVNDPPLQKKSRDKDNPDPDMRPRRDAHGKAYLPAKSLRGALRSQAERINRTLGGHACHVDDIEQACEPIESLAEKERLCPACQVFGATGWRSPIDISDFKLVGEEKELRQEFVAIDRFSGGGRDGAKFKAETAYAPVLRGSLELDLGRLPPWSLGLLALLMRDWMEGDMTFGYGASKGYGQGRAVLEGFTLSALERLAKTDWQAVLDKAGELKLPERAADWRDTPALRQLVNFMVAEFQKQKKTRETAE